MSEDEAFDISSDSSESIDTYAEDGDELNSEQSQHTKNVSGSELSNKDCSVILLSIMNKHSLTYAAMDDILKLFSNSLPTSNFFPKTLHLLMKDYVDYEKDTIIHRCCGYCSQLLPSGSSSCFRVECRKHNLPDATFVEVCLDQQIKTLFSGTYKYVVVSIIIVLLLFYNRYSFCGFVAA